MTLDLSLRPSMRALRWAFGVHALCFALLLAAQPPPQLLLPLGAGFGASWLWLRRHPALGFGPRALVRLLAHADGSWTLTRAGGATLQAQLADESVVRGSWLVLRFRLVDGGSATRLIGGDELPSEALRRLRAHLTAA